MKMFMSVLVISVFSFFLLVSLSSAQHSHGGMSGECHEDGHQGGSC